MFQVGKVWFKIEKRFLTKELFFFADYRSNEHSLANLNDDQSTDSQVIDKKGPMVSVALLNGSSERQLVSEETSHPPDENLSNQQYSCNICGTTLQSKYRLKYHKVHWIN